MSTRVNQKIRNNAMKTNLMGITVAAVASALTLISGIAVAQNLEEVTVQGTRMVNTKTAGRTASGIPIVDVSLSYGVSTAGLDLASYAGAMELEKRVRDAAMAACKEISKQYPDATPSEADCAKAAADKAMVKAHELETTAAKKSAK
jgi:UrcA family protein